MCVCVCVCVCVCARACVCACVFPIKCYRRLFLPTCTLCVICQHIYRVCRGCFFPLLTHRCLLQNRCVPQTFQIIHTHIKVIERGAGPVGDKPRSHKSRSLALRVESTYSLYSCYNRRPGFFISTEHCNESAECILVDTLNAKWELNEWRSEGS